MLFTRPANTNGFPAELEDSEWLASHCQPLGDETIAAELGVSRKTIRRAYARFGIPQPTPTSSNNGSRKKKPTSSPNGSRKPTTREPNARRPLASDQQLAARVGHVKKGLEVVVASLVRLANEMEWVGDHVQPQTTRPAPASSQRQSGSLVGPDLP
jgi:hypothetical protein